MMNPIRNFFALASVSLPFLEVYRSQFLFSKKKGTIYQFWLRAVAELPQLLTLSGPLSRRIAHYLHANSMTAQWFSILHHKKLSEKEQAAGWYLAIATPIADHLVDRESLSLTQIEGLLDGTHHHPYSGLAQELYRLSKSLNDHTELFDQYLKRTLSAQAESLHQNHQKITPQQLRKITWDKGGFALLLYRSALNTPITAEEEKATYQLGGLMQLHNDIFDLFRDTQEGIVTLPAIARNVTELRHLLDQEIEKTMQLFRLLKVTDRNLLKFFLLLQLAVGTGHICLDQYRDLEIKHGCFDPKNLTRSELICDMEDFRKISKNLIRTLLKDYHG